MNMRCACLGVVAATALCSLTAPAGAVFTAFWQNIPISPAAIAEDPAMATRQCFDLMVTTDGTWSRAGLRAVLPSGQFFNHLIGGNTQPSPALVAAFPSLAFDTYVTAPGAAGGSGAPVIEGGFPEPEPLSMGGNLISVRWTDVVPDSPGTYQIARLTFPLEVIPNVINIDDVGAGGPFSNTSQLNPNVTIEIPNIPEPTSAALFSLAGALLARRRRR
jgi:hypothetical protein